MRIDIDLAAAPMGDVRKLRAMLDIWTGETPLPLFDLARTPVTQIVAGTGLTPPPTPTVVLDALNALKARSDSGELLAELNAQGMTVVLVTHESDIAAWARRRLVFRDGRVLEDVVQLPYRPPAATPTPAQAAA
jgi:hypothetical protein